MIHQNFRHTLNITIMFKNLARSFATSVTQNARYGGRHTAVLIPGDGIGPEMTEHLRNCFRLIQAPIDFETIDLEGKTYDESEIQYRVVFKLGFYNF